MASLKERVLHALQNGKNLESVLNDFPRYQENLLKNHSNPVFNQKDKNRILRDYSDLKDLEKTLSRYNKLRQHKYLEDAQEEKENAQQVLLKSGISYNRYIWHSENGDNTCDECRELDGRVFEFYDEVPERPHPNCKCYVEVVEDENENPNQQSDNKNEEPCDLVEQLDNLINELEESNFEVNTHLNDIESDVQDLETDLSRVENLIQKTNNTLDSLEPEYGKHLPSCENNVDSEYFHMFSLREKLQILLKDVMGIFHPISSFKRTFIIFASNYINLLYQAYILKQAEMDKYYHSKANCEATQEMGILGEKYAELLSDWKEVYDQYTYVKSHKVTLEEAIEDSERDQVANRLGRERGRKYPNCKCSELMKDLLPKNKK